MRSQYLEDLWDPRLKCYLKCFMMKNGILNSNAEVDVQRALRHLPRSLQESSKKLLNECKSVREYRTMSIFHFEFQQRYRFSAGIDHCEKAFQIVKCYVKHHPEVGAFEFEEKRRAFV